MLFLVGIDFEGDPHAQQGSLSDTYDAQTTPRCLFSKRPFIKGKKRKCLLSDLQVQFLRREKGRSVIGQARMQLGEMRQWRKVEQ